MRFRPYFGDTYAGIVTLGLAGAAICGLTSVAMFLFRTYCEPILRFVLTAVVGAVTHSNFRYDPAEYYYWAGYVGFLGVLVLLLAARAIIRKPAQDRIIDDALRGQTTDFANGAPLEPRR